MDEPRGVKRTDDGTLILDHPKALRAIAHPARAHAMDRLFEGDPLTATQLAEEIGITPSAMSYHLRELESWGIVERQPGEHDARTRPWRATGTRFEMRPQAWADRGRDNALGIMDRYLQRLWDRLEQLRSRGTSEPVRGSQMTYAVLYLTPEEREEVAKALESALNERGFGDRTPGNHPPDATRYQAWTMLLPEDD